jgi:predicted transcriptional regulator
MTLRKKPAPDPRLAPMAAILQLRFGELWRAEFPRSSGIPKATVYSVFSGTRPLTELFYARLIKAIDVEIKHMEAGVEKAKAIREKLE